MTARTSTSHPIQIAEIHPARGYGRVGITFCPGKTQDDAATGQWARDLGADLDAIASWVAVAVVTLIEDHELVALQVTDLGQAVRDRHVTWFHLPIQDVSTPTAAWESQWADHGPALRRMVQSGFDVLVHCKGGLGRAGLVAARLLIELGVAPIDAMAEVRRVRPGAIETSAQEAYVLSQSGTRVADPDRSPDAVRDRAIGALLGLAVGDATGTTVEFKNRDSFPPMIDMVGGGHFRLQPGQWTDDTAMALALADSLLKAGGLDEADLMDRFLSWWRTGAYSCTGGCFDIGIATSAALRRYESTGNPVAGSDRELNAGNGSLMRLSPVAIRYWRDPGQRREAAARQSRTTHASPACVDACIVWADMVADAIAGVPLPDLLNRDAAGLSPAIAAIVQGSWRGAKRADIRSTGYVAHSLEAALWCIARSHDFESAVLMAANLGEDADTTAAITGQLAGAIYGAFGIPARWRERVAWSDRITDIADRLLAAGDG